MITTLSREDAIFFAIEQARPMVRNLAWKHNLDVEDCMQTAAVVVLETIDKLLDTHDTRSPFPYLQRAIHLTLLEEINKRRKYDQVSLDKPLFHDDAVCLADVLPAPGKLQTKRANKRERALYEAIRRLPREEQDYILLQREIYGFDRRRKLRVSPAYSKRQNICQRVYRRLRNDQALAQAVHYA